MSSIGLSSLAAETGQMSTVVHDQAGIDILVNVYDLHDSNTYLYGIGTGFYHTGVQIQDFEYCFSSHGVVRTRPQDAGLGKFRESIHMGKFHGSMRVIKEIIVQMRKGVFAPGKYNLLRLNCNHFTDALVVNLLDKHIPTWVNRLAEMGSAISLDSAVQLGVNTDEVPTRGDDSKQKAASPVSEPTGSGPRAYPSAASAAKSPSSSFFSSLTTTSSLDMFSSSMSSMFCILCFAPSADMVCDDEAIVLQPQHTSNRR